jgi:N-acetylneuraminate synthase
MQRTFIIAEAGVNHNGSLARAKKMIDQAVAAGADAIKFQSFHTDQIVTQSAPKAPYQVRETRSGASQFGMLKKLELSEAAQADLQTHCREHGIEFLSTPFDPESLDFLVRRLHVGRIKIASGDINNAPLLLKAASSGKPIILSTGASTLKEVTQALEVLAFGYARRRGNPSLRGFQEAFRSGKGRMALRKRVTLLHCTSDYPAPYKDVHLRAMETMRKAFDLPVGLSDHTEGIAVPIAAVTLGAVVIEKHFTLDRNLPGPDHRASLEPVELKAMISAIRQVELAMGSASKAPAPSEEKNRLLGRKSLVAARGIKKGETFTEDNLAVKRPGTGIAPERFWAYLGKKSGRDYRRDELIKR